METARTVYRRYGFVPIDTPALEYLEVLTGKGSDETDRQMNHFTDNGGRNVGMRFDLTVPLARFAANIFRSWVPIQASTTSVLFGGAKRHKQDASASLFSATSIRLAPQELSRTLKTALVIHELLCEIGIERFCIGSITGKS